MGCKRDPGSAQPGMSLKFNEIGVFLAPPGVPLGCKWSPGPRRGPRGEPGAGKGLGFAEFHFPEFRNSTKVEFREIPIAPRRAVARRGAGAGGNNKVG